MEAINAGVALGGQQVTEKHYHARVDVCMDCPNWGHVPLPGTGGFKVTAGCKICKCPTATKPRWEKYFSFHKLRIVEAKCPDKINRWAKVDESFFNSKSN